METPACQRGDNLFAMESAIFDKNFAGVISADHHSGDENSPDIALMREWVHGGLVGLRIERDPQGSQEFEVRMVSRQCKNLIRRQCHFTGVIGNHNAAVFDSLHLRFKQRANLPSLDAILDVRPNPILDCRAQFRAPVNQYDLRAIAIDI